VAFRKYAKQIRIQVLFGCMNEGDELNSIRIAAIVAMVLIVKPRGDFQDGA